MTDKSKPISSSNPPESKGIRATGETPPAEKVEEVKTPKKKTTKK